MRARGRTYRRRRAARGAVRATAIGLDGPPDLTDAQRLVVYRLWKVAEDIGLEDIGGGRYRFDYLAEPIGGGAEGRRTAGIIDNTGEITSSRRRPPASRCARSASRKDPDRHAGRFDRGRTPPDRRPHLDARRRWAPRHRHRACPRIRHRARRSHRGAAGAGRRSNRDGIAGPPARGRPAAGRARRRRLGRRQSRGERRSRGVRLRRDVRPGGLRARRVRTSSTASRWARRSTRPARPPPRRQWNLERRAGARRP